MTKVLTIRIPPHLLAQAEAKAARLGMARAKYFRSLIERDLAEKEAKRKHKFASEDLVGCYTSPSPGQSATNARVRQVMRQRLLADRKKHR
jgi:predicted DNA-binding protein